MRFFALFFLISTSVFASHLETVCKSALTPVPGTTGQWYSLPPFLTENYLTRKTIDERGTRYVLESHSGEQLFESMDRLSGLIEIDQMTWLLSNYALIELDQHAEILQTYPIVFNPRSNEPRALDFTRHNDLLIVVRGRAGLVAFDHVNKKIRWSTDLPEVEGGMPVGVTAHDDKLFVMMATAYQGGFTGVVTVDPETGKVLMQTPYNQRRAGVMSVEATGKVYNDSLIINNGGWIHIIKLKDLESNKEIRPRWLAVEAGDDTYLHYMTLMGKFYIDGDELVGCGTYNERTGQTINRFSKLWRVPLN